MADLSTTLMGIPLRNPVLVAACSISSKIDRIKEAEASGAAGLVIKSLFEEQILREMAELDEALDSGSDSFAESLSYLPKVQHAGAKEHLMWIEKARKEVSMPLIGSLNAVTPGKWTEYAKQMAQTGVNAIELNMYAVEADITRSAADVEARALETFEAVRQAVTLPIAVKLSPYYTSIGNFVGELSKRGADSVVLFNRFLQPDISPKSETLRNTMTAAGPAEMRLALRWIALLYGRTQAALIGNTGVMEPEDVVRYILAGAEAVQVATVLYRKGVMFLTSLVEGLDAWMTEKGHGTLGDFRGKVSQKGFVGDAFAFERAHYYEFLSAQG